MYVNIYLYSVLLFRYNNDNFILTIIIDNNFSYNIHLHICKENKIKIKWFSNDSKMIEF